MGATQGHPQRLRGCTRRCPPTASVRILLPGKQNSRLPSNRLSPQRPGQARTVGAGPQDWGVARPPEAPVLDTGRRAGSRDAEGALQRGSHGGGLLSTNSWAGGGAEQGSHSCVRQVQGPRVGLLRTELLGGHMRSPAWRIRESLAGPPPQFASIKKGPSSTCAPVSGGTPTRTQYIQSQPSQPA